MDLKTFYLKLALEWDQEANSSDIHKMHIMADCCRGIAQEYRNKANACQ